LRVENPCTHSRLFETKAPILRTCGSAFRLRFRQWQSRSSAAAEGRSTREEREEDAGEHTIADVMSMSSFAEEESVGPVSQAAM